ncbi:MAG TPA: hypothetical protein DDW52_13735 [Planctomycetaceae bacterium]|nr:hypothetical protein [Planctomycetaceae bacterium]
MSVLAISNSRSVGVALLVAPPVVGLLYLVLQMANGAQAGVIIGSIAMALGLTMVIRSPEK